MAFPGKRVPSESKRSVPKSAVEVWQSRRQRKGFDWLDVDVPTLKAALAAATLGGISIGFTRASGGLGVCVTLWVNGTKHQEYAKDAAELVELLGEVVSQFQGDAEDLIAAMGGPGLADQVAAD